MKALIIFQEPELRDLVSLLLEGKFGFTVQAEESVEFALAEFLKDPASFQLILQGDSHEDTRLVSKMPSQPNTLHYFYHAENPSNLPLFTAQKDQVHFVSSSPWVGGVIAAVSQVPQWSSVFNSGKSQTSEPVPEENTYCKVKPQALLLLNPLPEDVFIRLSDTKFIRVLKKGIGFDSKDLDHFLEKRKVESLYIKKEHCEAFAYQLELIYRKNSAPFEEKKKRLAELVAKKELLEKNKSAPAPQKVDPAKHLEITKKIENDLVQDLEKVKNISNSLGFSPEVQEQTKKNVLATVKLIRKAPGLSLILSQLSLEKEKYISSHSTLMAYVSCALASQMEWTSDTTYQKLTLASFLHDITLKNQDLAQIQTLAELRKREAEFSVEDLKAFREHPNNCAEIARQFSEVPPDVDSIIVQHHERPDGSGFPRALTHSRIGPLATVFIVAHDLVSYIFHENISAQDISAMGKPLQFDKVLQENQKTYQFSNFRKVLAAIPKLKG